MLRLRRPSRSDLEAVVAAQRDAALTYTAVGGTLSGTVPRGYRFERYERTVGHGEGGFLTAVDRLRGWDVHRRAGIDVVLSEPGVSEWATVALAAPLPVGYAVAACRVVVVVDEPRRAGFAYGTLPEHPESGEELFLVEHLANDDVVFRIAVFSRPHQLLARLGSPIARSLQRRATNAYLDAMGSALG